MFEYKKHKASLMNNNAHLLMGKKNKTKPKTNQNKIKSNRMSMRLLGGIWSVIRLSPSKPKKNGRLKFTKEYLSLPVLLVLKFWDIPYKIFLLGQNGFLLRARARVKMEEKCRFW